MILSLASCQAENNENQEGKNEEKQEKEKNIANPLIEEKKNTLTFVDFAPVFFIQNHDKKIKIFDTFNDALDMYYSSMEIKSEKAEYEQKAWKKYENIKVFFYFYFEVLSLNFSLN